jgi:hypothetical protein
MFQEAEARNKAFHGRPGSPGVPLPIPPPPAFAPAAASPAKRARSDSGPDCAEFFAHMRSRSVSPPPVGTAGAAAART